VGAIPYFDATTPERTRTAARPPGTGTGGGQHPGRPAGVAARLDKPDLVATDGGQTTFFYDRTSPFTAPFRFYGTSEAAPHARRSPPCSGRATVAHRGRGGPAMKDTAGPVANGVPEGIGAGRVDAKAAGDSVWPAAATRATFNVSDASVQEGNGGFATAKTLVFTVTLSQAPPRRRR